MDLITVVFFTLLVAGICVLALIMLSNIFDYFNHYKRPQITSTCLVSDLVINDPHTNIEYHPVLKLPLPKYYEISWTITVETPDGFGSLKTEHNPTNCIKIGNNVTIVYTVGRWYKTVDVQNIHPLIQI